tara:strand:+ start:1089 stop:1511 length:423 start_codon:yes stop_codon:yes gene_type:complete
MPDFSKQQRDFLKGPGNKENFNETNFSGYDQANIAASPTMGLKRLSPLHDNGDKDGLTDEEVKKFKSDMGKYNPTITSYEGDAFVGTTGSGQRQPEGKQVTGITQTGNSSEDEFFRGKVIGSGSSKSKQDSRVKGASYRS